MDTPCTRPITVCRTPSSDPFGASVYPNIARRPPVMGGGGTYATYGMDSLAIVGFFCMVGLYLFYAALMVKGQAQAHLIVLVSVALVVVRPRQA